MFQHSIMLKCTAKELSYHLTLFTINHICDALFIFFFILFLNRTSEQEIMFIPGQCI